MAMFSNQNHPGEGFQSELTNPSTVIRYRLGLTLLFFIAIWAIGSPRAIAETTPASAENDVRILIDVSGSMRKNDPKNLRIPALKLLVNLLPPKSNAGIWLFAEDAIELAPNSEVDQKWKSTALKSTRKIHSRGLFTNIETALENAISGWSPSEATTRRSVILLTDGVVDVSKNQALSTQSRTRILQKLIPRIQQLSAQVFTIALSKNADHELLEKIAFDTGGWNESVHTADQLQRVFLKMFKKAVPQDSVPLKANKFKIDNSIKEFSLLAFRKAGALGARLIDPNGVKLSEKNVGETLSWRHESGYDLVTVKNPIPGEWQLLADVDPDNQVMIVTDLKLKLDELPNYVAENEALNISVSFSEQGQPITRSDFLNLVSVDLQQTDEQGRKRDWHMEQDKGQKGLYVQVVGETLSPGVQTFRIVANGGTFQRQIEQRVNVVENPISLDVSGDIESEPSKIRISLSPNTDIIDLKNLQIIATVGDAAGNRKDLVMEPDNGVWRMALDIPPKGDRLVINFSVTGNTLRGNPVAPKVRPVILDENTLAELFPPEKPIIEEKESVEEKPIIAEQDSLEEDPVEMDNPSDPGWVMTAVIAVIVNLVLGVAVFFLYKKLKKRSAEQQSKLLERLAT